MSTSPVSIAVSASIAHRISKLRERQSDTSTHTKKPQSILKQPKDYSIPPAGKREKYQPMTAEEFKYHYQKIGHPPVALSRVSIITPTGPRHPVQLQRASTVTSTVSSIAESAVSSIETETESELYSEVSQLYSNISQLSSDVSQLSTDVSQLSTDVSQSTADQKPTNLTQADTKALVKGLYPLIPSMPMGEWQTIPIPCILFPAETRDAWSKTVLTTAAYADKLDDIFAGYSRGVQLDSDRLPKGQQKQATMQGKAQELPNQELGQAFPEIYNEYYKAFMRIREDLEMLRDSCDTFMKLQHKGNDVTKQMLEDARLDINKTVTTGLNTVLTDVRGVELRPLPKMRMLGREGTFGLKREVPGR